MDNPFFRRLAQGTFLRPMLVMAAAAAVLVLPACAPGPPDALSAKDRQTDCKQLIDYVSQNKDYTQAFEENLSSEFHIKSTFASKAYWIYGYIDGKGELLVPPLFMKADDFSEGLARIQPIGGGYGFIDPTGKVIVQPTLTNARRFSYGLAAVEPDQGGPWGYIDQTGKSVIKPQYDSAWEFVNTRARVQKDGKWGYIDVQNTMAVPMIYDYAMDFGKDKANVLYNKRWYTVDFYGHVQGNGTTKRPNDDTPRRGEGPPPDYKSLLPFSDHGKFGYKDQAGNVIIHPQFDSAGYFSEGMAPVGYICTPPQKDDSQKQ